MSNGKKLAAGILVGGAAVVVFAAGAHGRSGAEGGVSGGADEAGAPSRAEFTGSGGGARAEGLILESCRASNSSTSCS